MKAVNQIISMLSWPWVVLTLLIFSALIKLGFWQLDRAEEKSQRLLRIATLQSQQALTLDDVLALPDELKNDFPVKLSGHFNNQYKILLDNQTQQGRVGFRVYQPFHDQLSGKTVLINLGWVAGDKTRQSLPTLDDFPTRLTLTGHIRLIDNPMQLADTPVINSWPQVVQSISVTKLSTITNLNLLPFAVFLDKTEQTGYHKNWQPIVMPPEKHRGYAFQWFSLATAWLLLMVWAGLKNNNNKVKTQS